MDALVRTESVSVRFGGVNALSGVTVGIDPGDRVILLGANGSGKSTLLRVFAGLVRAVSGTRIPNPAILRPGAIGYLGHQLGLYRHLTLSENLTLFSRVTGTSINLPAILDQWNLSKFGGRPTGDLSRGEQVRGALARVLMLEPTLILLDEPTAHLDDASTTQLLDSVTGYLQKSSGAACVIATHDLMRAAPFARRAVLLREGVVTGEKTKEALGMDNLSESYLTINR